MTATTTIDPGLLIPDLLKETPQVRPVLDRYGLRGCGGPLGPYETLEFFARAHEVSLPRLLAELEQAREQPREEPPAPPASTLGDRIYRPFFLGGLAVILSLGAVWGAYLLLRIGLTGSFRSATIHEVNAHGYAQIFGWVGLFVLGFAYQAFPRFKHASLAWPRLALATLGLLLIAVLLRSLGEPLAAWLPWAGPVAVAGSTLGVAAIVLFVVILLRTWQQAGWRLAWYDGYILAALGWFVLQAAYDTVYLAATLAADGDRLLALVATWQAPLREMQIHGFALLIILGVSQRIFPNFYGLPVPGRRLSLVALVLINLAVAAEVAGLVLMRTAGRGWAGLWYAGVLLLAGTAVVLLRDWRIFSRAEEPDRSLKFLRAAYVWLLISLGMAVLLPVYQGVVLPWLAPGSESARIGFSHAYYGAIRHAITVGFVSLMIVGVAAKVVPTLEGVDVRRLSLLWLPFLLINVGCALRVTAQTLTDFTPNAFPLAGVSGFLEVAGLAIWATHLVLVMTGLARQHSASGPHRPYIPGLPIEAEHRVGDVLAAQPELLETFVELGFRPLASPLLRATLAREVTIATACRRLGLDAGAVLARLNAAGRKQPVRKVTLPLLS